MNIMPLFDKLSFFNRNWSSIIWSLVGFKDQFDINQLNTMASLRVILEKYTFKKMKFRNIYIQMFRHLSIINSLSFRVEF